MAFYRIVAQLALTYGVATGRAVYRAWKQTAAQSAAAAAKGSDHAVQDSGMTIREAREILNVAEGASAEEITAAFKRIYELNAPDKGNSFYLQSKAFRAHETLVAPEAEPEPEEDGGNDFTLFASGSFFMANLILFSRTEPRVDKKEESNVSSKQ